ncbi:MAG: CDP-alcohol phosphatidyltransferase family protein [Victivallales bacterium]|jgi:CDP-diacylglycerol--serine O-phosphatidyltransferase|nr:CDP-alcohol phosphatidyltransferase family protein [Victivallales bacterium]
MKQRFKNLLKTNRWLKLVPNSLTLCNSLCGFLAILITLRAYESDTDPLDVFFWSAVIICCAMIFDSLDGFAARIFNAASMHGVQMDSLADMVTFGVAPATLVAVMTHSLRAPNHLGRTEEVVIYLLCSIYVGGAALRLATYNVHAILEKKSSDKFSGLPSPGAAIGICVVVAYAWNCNFDLTKYAFFLPAYAAILGILMVSPIPYTHAAKWLLSVRRNRKRELLLLLMLLIIAAFRIPGVAAIVTLYIFAGPALAIFRAFKKTSPIGKAG